MTKYDMRINPVYQVDCQISASGKWVSATKRRVRWRFGFSHRPSIEQGLTGPECRGEEHDIVLVWSLVSGKQLIMADGVEVFFQASSRLTDTMEASWTMKCGHEIKILAFASPPVFDKPGFRQFDLLIDGLSFWDMPKVFELGRPSAFNMRANPSDGFYDNDMYEESASMDFARSQPLRRSTPDVMSPVAASSPARAVTPPQVQGPASRVQERSKSMPQLDLLSSPPVKSPTNYHNSGTFVPTPLQTPTACKAVAQFVTSPTGVAGFDEFAPQPPTRNEMLQQRTDRILGAYQTPSKPHVVANALVPFIPSIDAPECGTPTSSGTPRLSMDPLEVRDLDVRDDDNMTPIDKAVHSLVHLEDITKTLDSPQDKKHKEQREMPLKAKPIPPKLILKNAPLAEIQKATKPREASKPIMRSHPQVAHAGMMVVYGNGAPASPVMHQSPMMMQPTYARYRY